MSSIKIPDHGNHNEVDGAYPISNLHPYTLSNSLHRLGFGIDRLHLA